MSYYSLFRGVAAVLSYDHLPPFTSIFSPQFLFQRCWTTVTGVEGRVKRKTTSLHDEGPPHPPSSMCKSGMRVGRGTYPAEHSAENQKRQVYDYFSVWLNSTTGPVVVCSI